MSREKTIAPHGGLRTFARPIETLAILFTALPLHAAESPLWPDIEQGVVDELCDRDVGEWAAELSKTALPDDFENLLLRFAVYLRAGHVDALQEVIERLPQVEASGYNAHNQRGYGEYNWLATRLIENQRFDLAFELLQTRPQSRCLAVTRLLDHLVDTNQVEQADELVQIYKPNFPDYFVELRRHIHTRAKHKPKLLVELNKQVEEKRQQRREQAIIAEDRPQDLSLPNTWIARAEYFADHKEFDKAETAFKNALELAPVANEPTSRSPNRRADVIRHYGYFLATQRGVGAMLRFLFAELEQAEPGSNYQLYVVQEMVTHTRDDDEGTLDPNDNRLWGFLETREHWSLISQVLLTRMAENTEGDMILSQRFWKRAESLAKEKITRAEVLGRLMVENGQYRRAIPLLMTTERERTKAGQRSQASLWLLQAYVALGESRAADDVWKRAVRSIPRENVPVLLGQVAVAAAHAGERGEAMKWWCRRTNFNRDDRRHINEMLAAGMRESLLEFYETLAKNDPRSDSPRHVTEYITTRNQR